MDIDTPMHPTTQDDLVDLFARCLQLSSATLFSPAAPSYASQHYTHTSHSTPLDRASTDATLRAHSINPAFLFASQLDLFASSPLDTRLRLLELWRTAPLRASDMNAIRYRYGELESSSLLQEEVLARLRLERDVAERNVVAEVEPYMARGYEAVKMEDQYGGWMAAREFERIQEGYERVKKESA